VLDEDAGFLERMRVEQEVDALARGQPAFGVELRDALLAAPFEDGLAAPAQLFDGLGTAQQGAPGSGDARGGRIELGPARPAEPRC
jgi:hypothetical protein